MAEKVSISIAVFSLLLTVYWKITEWWKKRKTKKYFLIKIILGIHDINLSIFTTWDYITDKSDHSRFVKYSQGLIRFTALRSDLSRLYSQVDYFNSIDSKRYSEYHKVLKYYDNLIKFFEKIEKTQNNFNYGEVKHYDSTGEDLENFFDIVRRNLSKDAFSKHLNDVEDALAILPKDSLDFYINKIIKMSENHYAIEKDQ